MEEEVKNVIQMLEFSSDAEQTRTKEDDVLTELESKIKEIEDDEDGDDILKNEALDIIDQ